MWSRVWTTQSSSAMFWRSSEAPASIMRRTAVKAGVTRGSSPSRVMVLPSISPNGFAAAVQMFWRAAVPGVTGVRVATTRVTAEQPNTS